MSPPCPTSRGASQHREASQPEVRLHPKVCSTVGYRRRKPSRAGTRTTPTANSFCNIFLNHNSWYFSSSRFPAPPKQRGNPPSKTSFQDSLPRGTSPLSETLGPAVLLNRLEPLPAEQRPTAHRETQHASEPRLRQRQRITQNLPGSRHAPESPGKPCHANFAPQNSGVSIHTCNPRSGTAET